MDAVVEPVRHLIARPGAWGLLLLVPLYKIGDAFALSLYSAFMIKGVGFSLTELAIGGKLNMTISTMIGTALGGWIYMRWGLYRSLLIFGVLDKAAQDAKATAPAAAPGATPGPVTPPQNATFNPLCTRPRETPHSPRAPHAPRTHCTRPDPTHPPSNTDSRGSVVCLWDRPLAQWHLVSRANRRKSLSVIS